MPYNFKQLRSHEREMAKINFPNILCRIALFNFLPLFFFSAGKIRPNFLVILKVFSFPDVSGDGTPLFEGTLPLKVLFSPRLMFSARRLNVRDKAFGLFT